MTTYNLFYSPETKTFQLVPIIDQGFNHDTGIIWTVRTTAEVLQESNLIDDKTLKKVNEFLELKFAQMTTEEMKDLIIQYESDRIDC